MTSYSYPDGSVFYRNLHYSYPIITHGRGCYLYDAKGKKYFDATGGAAVCNLGHGNKTVAQAMSRQAARAGYINGVQFTHAPVEKLSKALAAYLPFPQGKLLFLTSGSEAVEASIKLARQYWVERGITTKFQVISREPCYHGNTLAALGLSARKHYQEAFAPMLRMSPKIPAPYCYRCPWQESYPSCNLKCAHALAERIAELGKENVSAFIFEPVGGSSTGAAVPPKEYFTVIQNICRQNDVLMIADEVMCGAGRTGSFLACDHFQAKPDIVVMGKGLTSGNFPLSAIAAPKTLVDTIFTNSKSFLHAQTFSHHPVGCAAGLATLQELKKHRLIAQAKKQGRRLRQALTTLLAHPQVGDVRGQGLLLSIEFVADKKTKTPFPRQEKFVERFQQAAREHGLVFWPNTGHADGFNGDLVMIAPPFIISDDEIDSLVKKIESSLQTVVLNSKKR